MLAQHTNHTTVETFTVNALNQVTGLPDGAASYDRRGNLVTRTFGGSQAYWTWTWDHENQLTRVQTDEYYTPEASRWEVEFTYDGQGRLRVKKDYVWSSGSGWYPAGETRYLYDGLLLVQERTSANTPTVTYTRGRDLSGSLAGAGGIGGLLARSHGYSGGNWSSHHAYHADGNGNVTALASSAGTLQASYRYDPYGRYLAGGGTLAGANGLRFSSKPWVGFAGSATSGQYYYGFRFYDPYLQRWVNRDPLGEMGSVNLYSFLDNQTLDHLDAAGLFQSSPVPSGTAGCTTKEYWQLQRWIAESCEGGPKPVPFVPPIVGPSEDDLKTKPLDLDDCIDACKERYTKPEQKKDLWLCIQKCAQIYPPKHPKYKPPKPGRPTRGPKRGWWDLRGHCWQPSTTSGNEPPHYDVQNPKEGSYEKIPIPL